MYYNRLEDKNLVYDNDTATFSKKITQNQFNRMYDEVRDPENNDWGYFNTSTNFAERVFQSATGIFLTNSNFPKTLKSKILEVY